MEGYPDIMAYNLDSLENGTYRIKVVVVGIPQANTYDINLTGNDHSLNLNFCVDTSAVGLIDTCNLDWMNIVGVSSKSKKTKEGVIIYPNPAYDFITVLGINDKSTITISNVYGEEVYRGSFSHWIDISSLSEGIYIVQSDQPDVSSKTKFVKQ